MARTPKTLRKASRQRRRNNQRCGRPWRKVRDKWKRCTARQARATSGPRVHPEYVYESYQDLPAPRPVTGPLRASVVRELDSVVGWAFTVTAVLAVDPPVELRGFWSFVVKEGATRRFAERFARAIEAGVVVTDMDLRVDMFGVQYIHFDTQPWMDAPTKGSYWTRMAAALTKRGVL